MKTFIRILFFFLFVTQICFGQWYKQNSGTTATLNTVHFEDADNGIAVGDSGIILHTTNSGQDWITQTSGTVKDISAICFTDANKGWAVTGNEYDDYHPFDSSIVIHTTNGGTTWTTQIKVPTSKLYDVSFVNATTGLVVGGGMDSLGHIYSIILRTTNGGLTWNQQSIDTMETLIKVCFFDVNNAWIIESATGGWHNKKIHRTTDGGTNWHLQLESLYYWEYLSDISFADLNNGIAVGGETSNIDWKKGLIAKTTDGGETWVKQYISGFPEYEFDFIDVCFITNSIITVLGDDGQVLYWTTDGGINWTLRPIRTDQKFQNLNRLFFTDELTGWAVGDNGTILHTTNGGVVPVELTSFTAQAENQKVILRWTTATELNNNGFEIQRRVPESEFATIGFVRGEGTTTNQREYSYIDKDLVDGKYFYRLKQVDYNGTYEYSNVIEVDVRSLNEYALEQNFPNPFNPITTIGYVLREKSNAKLILLNAIGEEVAVLVNEEQDKGFHKVDFNASTLASGVYFYRLQAGDFVQTRKMILLK